MTTATTIGYGDITGALQVEKLFCICLEFVGILIFSAITNNIREMKSEPNLQEVINERVRNVEQFMFQIDRISHRGLDDYIYDIAASYTKQSYRYGVAQSFKGISHYDIMSSNIKNKLVSAVLEKYREKLNFFFNDIEFAHTSELNFIRRLLTALDCRIYTDETVIVASGKVLEHVYFI